VKKKSVKASTLKKVAGTYRMKGCR